jgi:malate dehydrogenase (oxaloacetate-decarboxylating)
MPDEQPTTTTESSAMTYRRRHRGLISVRSKVHVRDNQALSLVYTPGVAEPCLEIAREPHRSFDVTCRGNTVAIVSNGSSAFGMGNIGPAAILPVLESKAVIMKTFAGVDALPIAIDASGVDDFVDVVLEISPTFGAISIEDVGSPDEVAITNRLNRSLFIPVVNNHREGVAIGVLAGLINAAKLVGKAIAGMRIIIDGAGAAGLGTAMLLHEYGARRVIVADQHGALYKYRPLHMNWARWEIARISNPEDEKGTLEELLVGADAFIGFASGTRLTPKNVQSMAERPSSSSSARPSPSRRRRRARPAPPSSPRPIRPTQPDGHRRRRARRLPRPARRARQFLQPRRPARRRRAIAGFVPENQLHADYIYPHLLDYRVAPVVAEAVARATLAESNAKRPNVDPAAIANRTRAYVYEGRLPVDPPSGKEMDYAEESLELHDRYQGLLEIRTNVPVKDAHILEEFYLVPGAMEASKRIVENPEEVFDLTVRGNLVGVVSDGSAVLGLGNIGGRAALPVMEGKAILFHHFAGVEAFPICVATQDADKIIEIVKRLEPTFGGINLEDISAPRCFYIERVLREQTDIPIFHDDQHGTAVVVLAGILNACRLTGKAAGRIAHRRQRHRRLRHRRHQAAHGHGRRRRHHARHVAARSIRDARKT